MAGVSPFSSLVDGRERHFDISDMFYSFLMMPFPKDDLDDVKVYFGLCFCFLK